MAAQLIILHILMELIILVIFYLWNSLLLHSSAPVLLPVQPTLILIMVSVRHVQEIQ
jgi:hypothetical protein